METVYSVSSAKFTRGCRNMKVLPLQAKRQLRLPAQPAIEGASSNRRSTESWLIGRSKVTLIVWLVGTSVTSRLGAMLTMRGGLRAQDASGGAASSIKRRRSRRIVLSLEKRD